jgi:hypothetical protein
LHFGQGIRLTAGDAGFPTFCVGFDCCVASCVGFDCCAAICVGFGCCAAICVGFGCCAAICVGFAATITFAAEGVSLGGTAANSLPQRGHLIIFPGGKGSAVCIVTVQAGQR